MKACAVSVSVWPSLSSHLAFFIEAAYEKLKKKKYHEIRRRMKKKEEK